MEYGKILSRAWEITWKWKVLWLLGFLAALGRAMGSSSNTGYTMDEWGGRIEPEVVGALAVFACLALIIAIAVWVVSVIARGGLIAGVQQVADEGSTTFGSAWRVGVSRFWTLFGIGILAAIPLILAGIIGVIVLVGFILGGISLSDATGGGSAPIVMPSVFCGSAFCCGMVIVAIILGQIRVYAERAAVMEGLGWIDAFVRGWDVLKRNLGPTIVFWLLFLGLAIIIGVVIAVVVLALALPFFGIAAGSDLGGWLVVPVLCGGLLTLIVGALLNAIIEAFVSATWTLAYREMTGLSAVPAEVDVPATAPAEE
jgi:hypothetical protein